METPFQKSWVRPWALKPGHLSSELDMLVWSYWPNLYILMICVHSGGAGVTGEDSRGRDDTSRLGVHVGH